jgi:hypothetical protein
MMRTDGNKAVATENTRDDLEAIVGIGPKFSKALHRVGVAGYKDLARYSAAELSEALLEQAGVRVPKERIDDWNWIGQADELASRATNSNNPEQTLNHPDWRQHAGFSLFFDYVPEEGDERTWQTRVYHEESDDEILLPGITSTSWINWILGKAHLPVAAEPASGEPKPSAARVQMVEQKLELAILRVDLAEVEPAVEVRAKKLVAETHFQLTGSDSETIAAECRPFRIECHTVDLEGGASRLVTAELKHLRAGLLDYTSQQTFPVPEVGRYELHTVVLLLPPCEMMASHRGPIFNVVY